MNLPEQVRIDVKNITFECDDQRYDWFGGFGAIFKSYERGVKPGECRFIGNVLFRAAYIYSRGWFCRPEVCWTVAEIKDAEMIQRIKSAVFGQ